MVGYLSNNRGRLSAPPKHRGPVSIRMKFGAHVSIRGALHLAVDLVVAIDCEGLQILVGSPRQWREVHYSEHDFDLFGAMRRAVGLDLLVAYTAYLINLPSAG